MPDDGGAVLQKQPSWVECSKVAFTLLSISLGLYALYERVIATYLNLEVKAERHRYFLNSYQHIAQRAREVKWPDMPYEDLIALLKDLERDFQLLKARSSEPEDRHFEEAHSIAKKIRGDDDTKFAQSFVVGRIEADAQHVGDPEQGQPESEKKAGTQGQDEASGKQCPLVPEGEKKTGTQSQDEASGKQSSPAPEDEKKAGTQ
jgi:hypothetical protein